MNRIAWLVTSAVVLLVSGYLLFDKYYRPLNVDVTELVPENAALVYENKKPFEAWVKLAESELWKSFQRITSLKNFHESLMNLDSLGGEKDLLSAGITNGMLVSVHKISNNQFDAVLYIDVSSIKDQKNADKILEFFISTGNLKSVDRTYQNYQIKELKGNEQASTFSYLIHENLFIGSFTPFLIEDVVRLIDNDQNEGFFNKNRDMLKIPKLANDDGNVYINTANFNQLFNAFQSESDDVLDHHNQSMFYDITIENEKILLNGFTQVDGDDFLNTFLSQSPQKNNFQYYVSNKASHFYQLGIENGPDWHERLKKYWESIHPELVSERLLFAEKYQFDFDGMFAWLGSGISLTNIPSSVSNDHKLIMINTNDLTEAMRQLNDLSERLAIAQGDSVYQESFGELVIRELNVTNFPMHAFGPMFTGFEDTFYAVFDEYLVMAESIQTLKDLMTDIEKENTLGRSLIYNKFSVNTQEESNFKLVINTPVAWEGVVQYSNPFWKELFRKNSQVFKGVKYLSFDFSALDDNFYSSIAFHYEKPSLSSTADIFDAEKTVAFNYPLITKPLVVKSHLDNSKEVLLQDSSNHIMLISTKGEVLWEREIDGPMVSDVDQVDYYKNGKLQYFFATGNYLYIIDRLGNDVDDFPLRIDYKIDDASVIDYDKSKRYRFMLTDERGGMYLYNKEGVNLEGWTPREVQGRLACQPIHIRVRGKDIIMAIQSDGKVHAMNRRGEDIPGFPFSVDGRYNGDAHIQLGADLQKTLVSLLSREGRLVKFNLAGEIVSTDQLYRPTQESMFNLVNDALGKDYVIARQDLNRLVLLNRDKNELLSKDYLNTEELTVQYYNFSNNHQVFAISDQIQGFTYIYNTNGVLINSRPIDSDGKVGMMYYESKGKYEVFVVSGNTFKKLSF
ncbi:hypothetical protein FNH22_14705 [Fulvivirga sp. M361]|uniref:hypothetical protein n=1 Tax=Fulvivirga sp. M361 TaxID=2594266 RepID=UPI00117BD32C|nr:hypothetical protein [Fulvivirga sp. M361]TRX58306.1 hypothetical protein FNH22_14705 [Fulvivirga sp. M361]